MPENPLLPHAELRALLALTKRCTALEAASARKATLPSRRKAAPTHTSREAVLAATTIQLRPGDPLIAEPGDRIAAELGRERADGSSRKTTVLPLEYTKGTSRLLLAAAMASALRGAGTDRVALFLTQGGTTNPGWEAALTWAQNDLLPLLLVCTDASGAAIFKGGGKPSADRLQWGSVSARATELKLPILTVDGEDAVAMYRATQEAMLRARTGGGPAVLWAALPAAAELNGRSRTQRPVARLAQYLRARGIPVT